MTCAETLQTQAFIDGELEGPAAEAAERHIAGCAACQAFCEEAATVSDAIRRHAPRYAAPIGLRERVSRSLAREARGGQAPVVRRSFWRGVMGGALGGFGASGLAAALVLLALRPPSPDDVVDRLVTAHTRALMDQGTIQVVSSDHHTVKPWFAGRIDLSPPVQDFAAEGFKLAGGRLDKVAGAPAAVVVYRHGAHEIDLFVWADRGPPLPPSATRRGYHLLSWKQRDLDFAAVSDMQAAELAAFSALVRGEGE